MEMSKLDKVIKEWEAVLSRDPLDAPWDLIDDTLTLLKEQEAAIEEPQPWDYLWTAPDGTFKGRCDNCGFVHVFIEGHVTQYKFCPQCGEQKQEL